MQRRKWSSIGGLPSTEGQHCRWVCRCMAFHNGKLFTHSLSDTQYCVNGGWRLSRQSFFPNAVHVRLYIRPRVLSTAASTMLFPAVISTFMNDMKIVSCGHRGFEKLPFIEFLSAYDTQVWVLLVGFVTVLTVTVKQARGIKSISYLESAISMLKILLEQGNPFPEVVMTNWHLQAVTISVLLIAIILENAYKNTNVYNMIIPKKLVPYQYLQELVEDNFTIFWRTSKVGAGIVRLQAWTQVVLNDSEV